MSFVLRNFIIGIGLSVSFGTITQAAEPKIEVVPVVVWQGMPMSDFQVKSVQELIKTSSNLKVVHMVSPVYLMRGASESMFIRSALSGILRPGDVVGMHLAPYRDWSIFSKAKPGVGRGIYGRKKDVCDLLCGLESEMAGLSHKDLGQMISAAKQEFRRNGLGEPRLGMFEEGLVSDDIWQVAMDQGLEEDWSGFNLDLVRHSLDHYPFFQSSDQLGTALLNNYKSDSHIKGRSLDHVRFGIVLDLVTFEQSTETLKKAIEFAKANSRATVFPVFVSASSLVHTQFLFHSILKASGEISEASNVKIVPWSGTYDGGWSIEGLRRDSQVIDISKVSTQLNKVPVIAVDHMSDEKLFDKSSIKDFAPVEIVPSLQKVIPPAALHLSH